MRTFAFAVVLLGAVSSFAGMPPLENKTAEGLTVGLPKGWPPKTQSQKGTVMFIAQRPPGKADSPAVVVSVTAQGATASEDQLVDAILSQVGKTPKIVKREQLQGGGTVLIADGVAGPTQVRLGAVVVSKSGSAITATLISTPAEFDSLGGLNLVTAMLASIKETGTAAAPAAAAPQAAAPANDGRIYQADLAGVWDSDEGSVKQYANNSGGYAGASVVSMRKIYTVAANGSYTEKFSGYSGGTVSGGGRLVAEDYSGKWTLLPNGVLEITGGGQTAYRTIVSFTREADATMMMLGTTVYDRNAPPDSRCPCEKFYRANKR